MNRLNCNLDILSYWVLIFITFLLHDIQAAILMTLLYMLLENTRTRHWSEAQYKQLQELNLRLQNNKDNK